MADPAFPGSEMGPLEAGAGLAMVESRGVEGDDGLLPALMLGVANGAVVGLVPMVPFLGGDPGGDLDMTDQALGGGYFTGRDMARRAIGIPGLGRVGGAQGTRGVLRTGPRAPDGSGGRGQGQGEKRNEDPFRYHSYCYDISYILDRIMSN